MRYSSTSRYYGRLRLILLQLFTFIESNQQYVQHDTRLVQFVVYITWYVLMIANFTTLDTQYIAMTANVNAYHYCYCYVLHYCTIAYTTLQEFAPAIFTRCVALIQACIVATATAQLTGS
jgi:hypothetical protein